MTPSEDLREEIPDAWDQTFGIRFSDASGAPGTDCDHSDGGRILFWKEGEEGSRSRPEVSLVHGPAFTSFPPCASTNVFSVTSRKMNSEPNTRTLRLTGVELALLKQLHLHREEISNLLTRIESSGGDSFLLTVSKVEAEHVRDALTEQ